MKTIDKSEINSLKQMIKSCFTYGGADKDSYNFSRYIAPYQKRLTEEEFEKVYNDELEFLKNNFKVKNDVYVDGEGCTYNSLIKI